MEIMISVLTSGSRPETLRACLMRVAQIARPAGVRLRLLLVRNALPPEAHGVLAGEGIPWLEIIDEPRQGIPFARNAALRYAAAQNVPWLAFVDDDAAPDPNWLSALVSMQVSHDADAVTGPQVPLFPERVEPRLKASKVFRERRFSPGAPCHWAATNNVLFSVSFAQRHRLQFNEKMSAGGSDKEFFLRFADAGGQIVWAPDAVIIETVLPERLSLSWIRRREWRKGSTEFLILRGVNSPWKAVSLCLAKAGYYCVSAIRNLVLSVQPRHAGYVDAVADASHASGLLLGLFKGFRPKHYT